MIRHLYKKYWDLGFKSRLYDLLTPQAYLDSMARCVACVAERHGEIWLDAGCGSGLAIPFLRNRLKSGACYLGTDLLMSGLGGASAKAEVLAVKDRVHCFQSDLTGEFPLKENCVDIVLAHFSTYTVGDDDKRKRALENFNKVLKPSGTLLIVNPSRRYNAENIIRTSLEQVKKRKGAFVYLIKKWIVYPLTLRFGLKYIERQLKTGVWKAYSLEELCGEVRSAGFRIDRTEPVYADSAYLVVAEKE